MPGGRTRRRARSRFRSFTELKDRGWDRGRNAGIAVRLGRSGLPKTTPVRLMESEAPQAKAQKAKRLLQIVPGFARGD